MSATDRLIAIVAPVVDDAGLVLDDLEVTSAGKRRLVRITLDNIPEIDADGWTTTLTAPLSLDEVADVSRAIGEALDAGDALGGAAYVLEVTSPGIGKRLRAPRHFRRNVGRLLDVTSAAGSSSGRIVRAGETEVELAAADGTTHTLPYAAIDRAAVAVEFARTHRDDDAEEQDA